ncbi:hypothetical protein OIU91_41415 (plasmid) [Streptomyces sp. NBC_01456]|uniref:hypothetical protein n=1 Tax=unclassified Streptomyces TaxID=2593676 RepID=UPI002E35F2AB|nr:MULTISPECIES: hypothetical protein [unclassified Streptomyces]
MSYESPWTVRHIYSTADRGLRPYLGAMHGMLAHYRDAGLIGERLDVPVATASDLVSALSALGEDELVIADLHGAVDTDGAWLGPSSDGAFVLLDGLPARSWSVSALILTNCYGARAQFTGALARLNAKPAAVAGHFEVAAKGDTTPVGLVKGLLQHSDAGDEGGAFRALEVAGHNLRLSSAKAWVPELIKSADVVRVA